MKLTTLIFTVLSLLVPDTFGQTTKPTAPTFIIGAWAQPVTYMARWKTRGVNTLFGNANDTTKDKWEEAATSNSLFFIDGPGLDLAADAKQPYRLGFLQPDEPDLSSHVNTPGSRIDDLRASYKAWSKTGLPVFLNLAGASFDNEWYTGFPNPSKTDASRWGHRAAADGYMGQGDVIGFDYHLWTTGRPGAFAITRRLMDRASEWSGGKPIFVYVETCTQGTKRKFTADDYEAQVWQAVAYASLKGYKLRGVVYFATDPFGSTGGWPASFDATPPDVADRMTVVNGKLLAYFGGQVYTTPPATTQPTTQPTQPTDNTEQLLKKLDLVGNQLEELKTLSNAVLEEAKKPRRIVPEE